MSNTSSTQRVVRAGVHILSAFALAGATLSIDATPALAQDDAASHCNAAMSAYEGAVAAGDPAKLAALFTADGTETTPYGIFQGREAIAKFNGGIKGANDSDTLTTAQQVGSTIVCSGGYTYTFPPGGPVKEGTGTWTKVLTKSGNGWLLADLTWNSAPPKH